MQKSVLDKHYYEFIKLYPFLSKRRLCEYFKISDRTLRKYKAKLKLKKKPAENWKYSSGHHLFVDICYGTGPYQTMKFESFDELNAWIYAQPYYCSVYSNNDEGKLRMHIKVQTNWNKKPDVTTIELQQSGLDC